MSKEYSPEQVHNLICNSLEKTIEQMPGRIIVVGEVESLYDNREKSGWLFFSLTDGKGHIRCVVPPKTAKGIEFEIKDGNRLRVEAGFYMYPRKASIEVLVHSIERAGESDLKKRLSRLREKLDSEHLLEKLETRQVRTEPPPKRVAIISPSNSHAPMDIKTAATAEKTLGITLSVHHMKEYSTDALLTELMFCQEDKDGFDAIIIARGGGDNLVPYNDEALIRAVAGCDIPVIAAIGHAADRTLLDFFAAESFPTPTAAGAWLKELHLHYRKKKKESTKRIWFLLMGFLIPAITVIILILTGVFRLKG